MRLVLSVILLSAMSALAAVSAPAPRETSGADSAPVAETSRTAISFDRDIRPLLSDRCFRCHGPDAGTRRAGLRLDLRDDAHADRDGLRAVAPNDLEGSELWRRVSSHDEEERMPPKTSGKRPLNEDELALIRRWIEEGAEYEPHWSFVAPRRPALPSVRDESWARNPIDRFILAALEERNLAPSPPAPPAALARRVHLDLTGLPPTPEETAAFVADARDQAYGGLVRHLLNDEPWRSRHAEHLAIPWLDAARYADTAGIHMDAGRQMWLWRDWVIAAYRDNVPYDRFVIEQLAGDLLPEASDSQRIASGFNRNHVTSDEGGAIAEEYLVEYAVDRAATTASVFLGLTMGCARCHDHKFDPISQQEFYSFYSFFNSIEEPGLYSQTPDANRAHEPYLVVPTPEQRTERDALTRTIARTIESMDRGAPEDATRLQEFLASTPARAGVTWPACVPTAAESSGGASATIEPDGAVFFGGENPARSAQTIQLRTDATGLRLLHLEALADARLPAGRVGRAFNGNAVLTGVGVEAISVVDPTQRSALRFNWVWADVEQLDGDFAAANLLDSADARGWAVDAHNQEGNRRALLLAEAPFGFEGGTDLRVTLSYHSIYDQHAFGRVRLSVGTISDAGLDLLPVTNGSWSVVGPFPDDGRLLFETAFGPEEGTSIDRGRNFGAGNQYWRIDPALRDGRLNALAGGRNVSYVSRELLVPSSRRLAASLGSDDGARLFVNGQRVFTRDIERSLAIDQDRAEFALSPGVNAVVLRITNTGGQAGFYWRIAQELAAESGAESSPPDRAPIGELADELVASLLPGLDADVRLAGRVALAWKIRHLPSYVQGREQLGALEKRLVELEAAAPRTMVMKELAMPRETFVLKRGQYDQPDRTRPVSRGVPAALGALRGGEAASRLGLAEWMVAPENPLAARVAANRLWELFFGHGLVRTSEDFGHQGEWPSHPELLDWLAVEYRECGWNTRHMIELIVNSATYRQASRGREELREIDPDNRLLALFPRRRLPAESIRDQALYVAGLLFERVGGASVKPYQPEGLWQEVAMPQSNTRIFTRDAGESLWRRSLYTYWKRAAPQPSMLAFDSPTREACTIRRAATNTPLQALVLWNDEQFVEASRMLAQRTLAEPGDDAARLGRMFARCVGRSPTTEETDSLSAALEHFRARYRDAPDDAASLLLVGVAPRSDKLDPSELAAWTMIANAMLSLHATVTQS